MFDRISKLLLPILIVIEAALVWTGVLDLAEAVGVIIGIEVLLALVAARQVLGAVRRFRRGRSAGLDVWAALEDGLAVLLPRKVARVVAQEPRLWACLAQWVLRRRPREGEFTYHKRSAVGPLLLVVVFTTPVEVLLFELLIPWAWLRWVLLVAAIYLVFWAFGFYASLVVLPHRLEHGGLRLRYGTFADGHIPYDGIATAETERRRSPGGGDGLKVARQENAAYISVGGRTDIMLRLREPTVLHGLLTTTTPVTTIHLAADKPDQLVRELRERTTTADLSPGQ